MWHIDGHTHMVPSQVIAQRARLAAQDAHFGTVYADPRARLATAAELVKALDRANIAAAIAFGWAFGDAGLCRECNDYTLASAQESRGRLLPFAVVNAATAAGLREADRCLAQGALGIGELLAAGQGHELSDAGLDALLGLAAEARVPVLLHINEPLGHRYPGKGRHGPAEALDLVQRHPHNDLILAHWGGGLCFYELMPEVRAACARVYYDSAASHLLYDSAVYRHALTWAPKRVLWGSDYPLTSPARDLARIRALNLPPTAEADLLGGNIARLLGLTQEYS